uniref:Uncharacterized protein n=1 Tax=Serratia phage Kevin TaxID=3161161 RepID=A0AAU8KZ57_9CAUD
MRTEAEYQQYLYNLLMEHAPSDLPLKAQAKEKWGNGQFQQFSKYYLSNIQVFLKRNGIPYDRQPVGERQTMWFRSFVIHSVASVMYKHFISFDEAIDPKYAEERWEEAVYNNLPAEWRYAFINSTKEELLGA